MEENLTGSSPSRRVFLVKALCVGPLCIGGARLLAQGQTSPQRTAATSKFLANSGMLTRTTVEQSEKVCEFRVTECLWAQTFRDANAADIGYACICHPDFAAASAFNPKMKLIRTKTLMQGDSHCNHRWVVGA